jgi:hypothetical protein
VQNLPPAATSRLLPTRQIHLDFHTSEHITGVGERFDRGQFQKALQAGKVNSITLFAKCHHSWSYYPTEVGRQHPHLALDLLGEQIAACREIGVRCPIYYTVGWSANDAAAHPEWCGRERDGSVSKFLFDVNAAPDEPIPLNAWINLCPSGGYGDLMLAQTREICERWDVVDGFFYDICNTRLCWCSDCRAGMAAAGLDAESDADAFTYSVAKWDRFFRAIRAVIFERHPDATVFFNGITHPFTPRELLDAETHFELEDLPTAWGGYDKLPPRARFFAALDPTRPRLGMTGKFHTSWGEFGGYKHADALKFEVAAMAAFGCGCSVGDQLHPSGEMDEETYRRVGAAYEYMERIEGFGIPSEPFARLALWPAQAGRAAAGGAAAPWAGTGPMAHDEGTAVALLECHADFAVIDPDDADADLSQYAAIVLSGGRCLDRQQAARLRRYAEQGGALLLQYESVLDRDTGQPLNDLMTLIGGRWIGPAGFRMDYAAATGILQEAGDGELPPTPVLCDLPAVRVLATNGTALGHIHEPYFDRTYGHYCSHRNTPNRTEPAEHALGLKRGTAVYLAHPLGALYHAMGGRIHREMLRAALRLVYTAPALAAALPSAGRATLLHQPQERRYVAHLLYAPPHPRGKCLVLEDFPELRDVALTVRVPHEVRRVSLPLAGGAELEARRDGDALRVIVPSVRAHQIVVFAY